MIRKLSFILCLLICVSFCIFCNNNSPNFSSDTSIDDSPSAKNSSALEMDSSGAKVFDATDLTVGSLPFRSSYDACIAVWGEPSSKSDPEMQEATAEYLITCEFPFGTVVFTDNNSNEDDYTLYKVQIRNNSIDGPAGLRVGDREEKLLAAFTVAYDENFDPADDGQDAIPPYSYKTDSGYVFSAPIDPHSDDYDPKAYVYWPHAIFAVELDADQNIASMTLQSMPLAE